MACKDHLPILDVGCWSAKQQLRIRKAHAADVGVREDIQGGLLILANAPAQTIAIDIGDCFRTRTKRPGDCLRLKRVRLLLGMGKGSALGHRVREL
jgi:hypothetical protein